VAEFTNVQRRITELAVVGRPAGGLGRHINHDERSNAYRHAAGARPTSAILWPRSIPVLDQGQVGSCTGNACVGVLATNPNDDAALVATGVVLDEAEALTIYSAAEVIDGDGPYPPNDNGSSGLSAAQAAKNAGLCSGYQHALTVEEAYTAIGVGPFMVGSNWYSSFDSPDASGVVTIAAGATVRGGHEYECRGYDPATGLWHLVNSWGTSYGVAGEFFYSDATLARLLAESGDITSLVPLSQPAPVPTPTPTPTPSPVPTPTPTPTPPKPPPPTPPAPSDPIAAWLAYVHRVIDWLFGIG
jgi:hypothetical protein